MQSGSRTARLLHALLLNGGALSGAARASAAMRPGSLGQRAATPGLGSQQLAQTPGSTPPSALTRQISCWRARLRPSALAGALGGAGTGPLRRAASTTAATAAPGGGAPGPAPARVAPPRPAAPSPQPAPGGRTRPPSPAGTPVAPQRRPPSLPRVVPRLPAQQQQLPQRRAGTASCSPAAGAQGPSPAVPQPPPARPLIPFTPQQAGASAPPGVSPAPQPHLHQHQSQAQYRTRSAPPSAPPPAPARQQQPQQPPQQLQPQQQPQHQPTQAPPWDQVPLLMTAPAPPVANGRPPAASGVAPPPPRRRTTPGTGLPPLPPPPPPVARPRSQHQAPVQPPPRRPPTAAAAAAAPEAAGSLHSAPKWGVEVRGVVKRITHESDTGWKILSMRLLEDASVPAEAAAHHLKAPRSPTLSARGATATLLGVMPGAGTGCTVVARGTWTQHDLHGWQIKVVECEVLPPEGADSVVEYLAGTLKGVGPKTASLIVAGLGPDAALEVLNSDGAAAALAGVKGIGPKMAARIKDEWDRNEGLRDSTGFLTGLGLPPALAHRIATRHSAATEDAVRADPFEAMQGVVGYTWRAAEALADRLGHDPGSPARGGAALLHVLRTVATSAGHSYLPWAQLRDDTLELLAQSARPWPSGADGLMAAARAQRQAGRLVVECESLAAAPEFDDSGEAAEVGWRDTAACMSADLWQAEDDVAGLLAALARRTQQEAAAAARGGKAAAKRAADEGAVAAWMAAQERDLSRENGHDIRFSEGQRVAITTAALSPGSILTGGPGCGKTFATRAVVQFWASQGKKVAMCAPTGRAAQRLQEIVALPGLEASTIHRLLGYKGRHDKGAATGDDAAGAAALGGAPDGDASGYEDASADQVDDELDLGRACLYGKGRPLPHDCVLLDEASMMDLPLAAALFNAIDRRKTKLVIVGDPDQLPPVGPGAPLRAAIDSGLLPLVDLRQVFRQSAASTIVRAAHAINTGVPPELLTWALQQDGAGLDQYLATLPRAPAAPGAPAAPPALPSDALLLQLPGRATAADAEVAVSRVVGELLPALGWDISRDVQVLSPTKKGPCGVGALNGRLQPLVNPPAPGRREMPFYTSAAANAFAANTARAARLPPPAWREGDRVVQTANDYDRGIWNGDLGYVTSVDPAARQLVVTFPGAGASGSNGGGGGGGSGGGGGGAWLRAAPRRAAPVPAASAGGAAAGGAAAAGAAGAGVGRDVLYKSGEVTAELMLAWATTVHKSQGGEYPVVVLALHKAFPPALLNRLLLYTAITRAKKLLVVVASAGVLDQATRNAAVGQRLSGLGPRLARAAAREGLMPVPPRVFGGGAEGGEAGGAAGAAQAGSVEGVE